MIKNILVAGISAGILILIVSFFRKTDKSRINNLEKKKSLGELNNDQLLDLATLYQKSNRIEDSVNVLKKVNYQDNSETTISCLFFIIMNLRYLNQISEILEYIDILDTKYTTNKNKVLSSLKNFVDKESVPYTFSLVPAYYYRINNESKFNYYKSELIKLDKKSIDIDYDTYWEEQ
ncbi:MAG: hypothetical protein HN691_18890 [Bacteroidetes bacterium]|jgi:hypothetical protein|nr:hypothetical protein [Bacteroidota bacterium]